MHTLQPFLIKAAKYHHTNNDQEIHASEFNWIPSYIILPSLSVSRQSGEIISVIYYQEIEFNLFILTT